MKDLHKISLLYSEDCPSHHEALSRLRKILHQEGITVEIETINVRTNEEAITLHFRGSPTILIDGQDIDPSSTEGFGLACRAYRLEDGRISPLPSESMIRKALRGT
jgi:hypothetical protein